MTSAVPNNSPQTPSSQQVLAALERAAQQARRIADQTGTQLVQRPQPVPPGKSQS